MNRILKAIAAIMIMILVLVASGYSTNNKLDGFEVEDSRDGSYNGHEYVDLGLPSGALWATCNVGANTPEEYGDYFAWGETQPKVIYNWSTYKYCKGEQNQLTKYCYSDYGWQYVYYNPKEYGYNGFTDTLTVLQENDDAASINWGSGWRTPTKEQWDELLWNTTSNWTSQNGVSGWLFTASNGNSLFLPASGIFWESEVYEPGSHGCYWLSSLNFLLPPVHACHFSFESDFILYADNVGQYRAIGGSVRPVYLIEQ